MMNYPVIIDLVLVGLLTASIAFAVQLSRRLSQVRNDQEQLERLASSFQAAMGGVQDGIGKLRVSTDELGGRCEDARVLTDDLRLLIDRGNQIADRLETTTRPQTTAAVPVAPAAARAPAREMSAPTPLEPARRTAAPKAIRTPQEAAAKPGGDDSRSAAERNLMAALGISG